MANQYMAFGGNVYARLKNEAWFMRFVQTQYESACVDALVAVTLDNRRLWDAHGLWLEDLDRLKTYELAGGTPDHYKQSGHLIYWLRRSSPVIAMTDIAGKKKISSDVADFRTLLFRYGNEYLAFDLGFRLCRFFESQKEGLDEDVFRLKRDYLKAMAQFLKTKNVSPHALYIILKSLFLRLE